MEIVDRWVVDWARASPRHGFDGASPDACRPARRDRPGPGRRVRRGGDAVRPARGAGGAGRRRGRQGAPRRPRPAAPPIRREGRRPGPRS